MAFAPLHHREELMPKILIEWTDERVEKLKTLYAEGLSFNDIADQLGLPGQKNAVLGKADRLKLPKRRKAYAQVTTAEKLEASRQKQEQKRQLAEAAKEQRIQARAAMVKPVAPELPSDQFGKTDNRTLSSPIWQAGDRPLLSLLQLNEHTCKFPLGDPLKPGFGFCGEHTAPKLNKRGEPSGSYPYCADHHRITTIQPEARK